MQVMYLLDDANGFDEITDHVDNIMIKTKSKSETTRKKKCALNKWGILMTKIQILNVIQVAEICLFVPYSLKGQKVMLSRLFRARIR